MKITDSRINPLIGLTIKVWQDGNMMRMAVSDMTETVWFRPGEGVEIRVSGQGNQPMEVATYRVITGPAGTTHAT